MADTLTTTENTPPDNCKIVTIYTDGACLGNPGAGGWGALLRYGQHERELSGAEAHTTNNRMELQAAIEALNSLKNRCIVHLHTDSTYVQQGMLSWLEGWKARGWRTAAKKPVQNIELWQALDALASKHEVHWHWVKAHNGHPDNERVDTLARNAAKTVQRT